MRESLANSSGGSANGTNAMKSTKTGTAHRGRSMRATVPLNPACCNAASGGPRGEPERFGEPRARVGLGSVDLGDLGCACACACARADGGARGFVWARACLSVGMVAVECASLSLSLSLSVCLCLSLHASQCMHDRPTCVYMPVCAHTRKGVDATPL